MLLNLSLTGCLLRVRGMLKTGGTYRVTVTWREGVLELPGRVARDGGRSGKDPTAYHYGLAFNLTGGQEKSLMRLIDLIRRTPDADEKGFMRSYWG